MSPLPPTRRGACPALSRPMETGDGLIARLMPTDGILSPNQLLGLAASARAFGNGLLEVSARGSLQVRGLTPETVAPLNDAVSALAIVPREGVPMDLSPLSGLDPDEIADARPLAAHLKAKLAAAGITAQLGPKVSVVLDGGGAVRLDALAADVRLCAVPGASRPLWALALAGDAADARPVGLFDADAAVDAALDWLARLAALGPSARMGDVLAAGMASTQASEPSRPAGRGSEAVPAVPRPRFAAQSSCPTSAGSGHPSADPRPQAQERGEAGPAHRPASSALASLPDPLGATGQGPLPTVGEDRERAGIIPPAPLPVRAPIGRLALRDGTFALGVGVPFGQIEADTLTAFVTAAAQAGTRDLRPAPGRVLLACGLTVAGADRLAAEAEALDFLTTPDDPRAFLSVCPGAPACRSAHMPARAMAREVADALAPLLDGTIAAHLSACAKGCAHPAPAALTFVGMDEGIGLVRDGSAGAPPAVRLAPEDFLPAVRALVEAAHAARRPGEDARSALARCGVPGAEPHGPHTKTQLEPFA